MRPHRKRRRRGATAVEAAICFPILFVLICMIFQLGHVYFVRNQLQLACRDAVRYGATDGVSSIEAKARLMEIMAPVVIGRPIKIRVEGGQMTLDSGDVDATFSAFNDRLWIQIKDAAIYDTGGPYPQSEGEVIALPEGELRGMPPRRLFSIRAELKYRTPFRVPGLAGARFGDKPLMPGEMVMSTYAFSRHE